VYVTKLFVTYQQGHAVAGVGSPGGLSLKGLRYSLFRLCRKLTSKRRDTNHNPYPPLPWLVRTFRAIPRTVCCI